MFPPAKLDLFENAAHSSTRNPETHHGSDLLQHSLDVSIGYTRPPEIEVTA